MSTNNIKLVSGRVFLEPADNVTTDDLNRMFEDGRVVILSPITIAQGGTGANNAKDARTNLGIASIKSLKGFGAIGDGVADDTTAIQAALDDTDNDMVYVPPGNYLHTSPLVVPTDTVWTGAGKNVSFFTNGNVAAADSFTINGTGSDIETGAPVTDIAFSDIGFVGNVLSGHGWSGNIFKRVTLNRCKFDSHGKNGINFGADNNTVNNKFASLYIVDNCFNVNVDAISISGGMHAFIVQNSFDAYTSQAIVLMDMWSVLVQENRGRSIAAATGDVIESNSSGLNNANVRRIRANHIRSNVWEDVRTAQDYIHISTNGTTENCASSAIGNMADKSTGDFNFIDLSGTIKAFRMDSNGIISDITAGGAIGINIGTGADATFIGGGNCFENGVNIVDAGTNTNNQVGGKTYILIQDQKATGVDGGTFAGGSWLTRDLNTIVHDSTGAVTLSANKFTLPSGTYDIHVRAPCYAVDNAQARLFDVDNTLVLAVGHPIVINSGGEASLVNTVFKRITLAVATELRVEHIALSGHVNNGFGDANIQSAGNSAEIAIYTEVIIR